MSLTREQYEDMQEAIAEERAAQPRYCNVCHNCGHNCPECSGWEETEDGSPAHLERNE